MSAASVRAVYPVSPRAARKLVEAADSADVGAMRRDNATFDRLAFDEHGNPSDRHDELAASREEAERVADRRRRERRLALGVCRVEYGMSHREHDRLRAQVEFERGRNRFNVRALMTRVRGPLERAARVVHVHRSARRTRRHQRSFTRRVAAAGAKGGDPPDGDDPPDGEVDEEDDSLEARVLRCFEYEREVERDDEWLAEEASCSPFEATETIDALLTSGELRFADLLGHVDGVECGFVPTLVRAPRRVRS